MKVIKELEKKGVKITVFQWNNKYLVKYETKDFEQTYKIPVLDVLDESELITKITEDETGKEVVEIFNKMTDLLAFFTE